MAPLSAMLLASALAAAPASTPPSACHDLLPPRQALPAPRRLPTARDLVRLRDIGEPTERVDLESPLGVSPDGTRAAFVLRRAFPEANGYCTGLVALDLQPGAKPRLLDLGGELIRQRWVRSGLIAPETGLPAIITPVWSPDGRSIAWRKRTDGPVQAWVVSGEGGDAHPVTRSSTDVESLAWSKDGGHLVYSTATGLMEAEAAIAREGREGYLFDDRFRPVVQGRPFARATIDRAYLALDLATGISRSATNAERALIDPSADGARPAHAVRVAAQADLQAWTELDEAHPYQFSSTLRARIGGRIQDCKDDSCASQIAGLWRNPGGTGFIYLRREGYAHEALGLYRWDPTVTAKPRLLYRTHNLLIGCVPGTASLICLEEGSTMPRRLVSVDATSGRVTPIFDPNPEFRELELGSVTRLKWRNALGFDTFGDLVLPPGHRRGQRHPMVVVQYSSRGFLRGGTGDEFPIQLFAARGFAVLSFQHPPDFALSRPPVPGKSGDSVNLENWSWRRSVQSSLEVGIERVIESGVVDPKRIGITGLSDGSTSLYWALINSNLFTAAASSSCCIDEGSLFSAGPRLVREFEHDGYPTLRESRPEFWRRSSLAANADRIATPILLQLSDDEYEGSFRSYFTLKAWNRPVEMYVFPGERHIKWQSAHRLAIYERSVDWFDFWLNAHEDPAPEKSAQYTRWRTLRERSRQMPVSGGP